MNAKIKSLMPWINVGLIIIVLILIEYLITEVLNVDSGNRWYF